MNRKPVLGMILKGYPRISEAFISNEILLLEKLGFSIHIFSMRRPREAFSHKSVKQIRAVADYLPHELLRFLPPLVYHNLKLALRRPQAYRQALAAAFVRWRRSRKAATVKHLLQAGFLVQKLLPGTGVTHFHAHFAHSPASVAMFASRLSGLPFSFTAHAKDIYTSNRRQLREKVGLARFVVTCTEYNRDYLAAVCREGRSAGCRAHAHPHIYRVYHGIDLGLFRDDGRASGVDAPGAQNSGRPFQILTVARIIEKKGLPTVYRALRRLRDQGLDVRHTLIGDGDTGEKEKLFDLVRELGLADAAAWIGTQPHEVVLDNYRRADLFALGCQVAANGDRDGIPNVLVESMAMSVPVVATRVSAIPELVENEVSGLLVPPKDPEALAHAMSRLLTDRPLRQRITAAARQRVVREFDNRTLIRELAAIYGKELSG
jgi:glycosyltransferase involved in cell wall biosynthesis